MTYTYRIRESHDISFDRFPHLGFEVGDDPVQKVHFVFWRASAAPDDWQEVRRVNAFPIPNAADGRTIYQHQRNAPQTLETGLWFRSRNDFQRFLAMGTYPGMLRMNRMYTMHEPDRTVTLLGRTYAEFDNVRVMDITRQTFDNDGGVRCQALFTRTPAAADYYGYATYAPDEGSE